MPARRLESVRCPPTPESTAAFLPRLRAALDDGPAVLALPDGPDPFSAALRPDLGAPPEAAVVVGTSGSTGVPKGVLLPAAALRHSARATHERLGGAGHWLLALPIHHVAGLLVLVRALDAGTPVSTVERSGGFTAEKFTAAAARLPAGRRYTALVPTQLRRLLDTGAAGVAATFDAILIGGAAATPALLERARAAGIRAVTTYGMSETTGGCVYDGTPLSGVDVRVEAGDVLIAGQTLAAGYLRRPDLTAAAFADGWFRTHDVGRWADGRLEVLGRADDVVVTGGEKVPPVLVERALCTVAGVQNACVVGIPDAQWGQAVAAAVSCAGRVDAAALRRAVAAAVGRHAVPKHVSVVDELPFLPSGKVDRAAVAALFLATQRGPQP